MFTDKKPVATCPPQKDRQHQTNRPVAAKESRAVEVDENRYGLLFIIQGSAPKLLLPCFGDDAHSVLRTAVKGQMLFTGI